MAMAIIVNLDVMMARRKVSLGDLADNKFNSNPNVATLPSRSSEKYNADNVISPKKAENNAGSMLLALDEAKNEPNSADDPEKEALKKELQALKEKQTEKGTYTTEQDAELNWINEQKETVLKMIDQQQTLFSVPPPAVDDSEQNVKDDIEDVMPVPDMGEGKVSTLKRGDFYGINSSNKTARTTIKASAYGLQTISSGQNVRFRLREPMQVGGVIIQSGSIVVGEASIGVDRIYVHVSSVEYKGSILSVRMDIFDTDGLRGLYVPGSIENEAVKEITSEVANSMGTASAQGLTIVQSQSAIDQIKADAARSAIQGTARYVGRKLSEMKVTIQDNHRVYLMSTNK